MRRVLRGLWAYLREVSGEAELHRRITGCGCHSHADRSRAVEAAFKEKYEGVQRCC
ncbi:MAG TPA: hypothetical protein V6D00_07995 [Pantanalinema sp.]